MGFKKSFDDGLELSGVYFPARFILSSLNDSFSETVDIDGLGLDLFNECLSVGLRVGRGLSGERCDITYLSRVRVRGRGRITLWGGLGLKETTVNYES